MAKARTAKAAKSATQTAATLVPLDITTRDDRGRTPLHLAALHGYIETVRRMLDQDAEIDARDQAGCTPAHWAAFKGHLSVVRLLVTRGADVNARDEGGRTPLKMAVTGEQASVEEFLREHGGLI